MRNPLQILFGAEVVSRLRRRPDSLRRIAERSKALLMSALNTDQNPEMDHASAQEVSEAFTELKAALPEELDAFVTDFLEQQGGKKQIERLKLELRDARKASAKKTTIVPSGQAIEIDVDLKQKLDAAREERDEAFKNVWPWVMAGIHTDSKVTVQKVSRGLLHNYRLIVATNDKVYKYQAFDFDIGGRIRRSIMAINLPTARKVHLFKGKQDNTWGAYSSKAEVGHLLIGSLNPRKSLSSKTIYRAVIRGEVLPFVEKGKVPVMTYLLPEEGHSIEALEQLGEVLELIHLKTARREILSGRKKTEVVGHKFRKHVRQKRGNKKP